MGWREDDRNVWREASKTFARFKVRDKVLKGVQYPPLFAGVTFLPLPRIPKIRELLMQF